MLPFTTVAAGIALLYLAWVFYARWSQNQALQRAAEAKSSEQTQKTFEMYGAGQLKILMLYANPAIIRRGGSTQLCYSVANATRVKFDGGVEEITPSLNRCVVAKPRGSMTYTMTAEDDKGGKVTKTVDVVVR